MFLSGSVASYLCTLYADVLLHIPMTHNNGRYAHYNWTHVATESHTQLALDAARQSIVLLQNPKGVLPLQLKEGATVLVAGQ